MDAGPRECLAAVVASVYEHTRRWRLAGGRWLPRALERRRSRAPGFRRRELAGGAAAGRSGDGRAAARPPAHLPGGLRRDRPGRPAAARLTVPGVRAGDPARRRGPARGGVRRRVGGPSAAAAGLRRGHAPRLSGGAGAAAVPGRAARLLCARGQRQRAGADAARLAAAALQRARPGAPGRAAGRGARGRARGDLPPPRGLGAVPDRGAPGPHRHARVRARRRAAAAAACGPGGRRGGAARVDGRARVGVRRRRAAGAARPALVPARLPERAGAHCPAAGDGRGGRALRPGEADPQPGHDTYLFPFRARWFPGPAPGG